MKKKKHKKELYDDGLMREKDVCKFLNISIRTIQQYRIVGSGPKYYKIGRAVRYSKKQIITWLDNNQKIITTEMRKQ